MSEIQLDYFKEAILFLKKFQWLYKMPVTKVLCKESLDMLPDDWLQVLNDLENDELNDFVTESKVKKNWPESLKNFIESCQKFNKLPKSNISLSPIELPESFLKKLSSKKQHEIFHLAQFIHEQCQRQNISLIVDLGCGLGYICQLLNYLYGYRILGLDCCSKRVAEAKIRQENTFPDSLSSVKYVSCKISNDSSKQIESIVQREFGATESICLIGLHACGDLSVYMSKIYSEMKEAKLLVLVSCCYHKLIHENTIDDDKFFKHFPFSRTMKDAVDSLEVDVGEFLGRPFMRLACQETSDRWHTMSEAAHKEHSFYVLARAVLELYAVENGLQLKKLVRKATRKSQCTNFDSYLKDCMQRYVLENQNVCDTSSTSSLPWDDQITTDLMELWERNVSKQKSIESYTALQLVLQSAAESLVLMDRLHYLRENGFEANIIQIMNRALSPRCYAIVSNKKLDS